MHLRNINQKILFNSLHILSTFVDDKHTHLKTKQQNHEEDKCYADSGPQQNKIQCY